MPLTRSLLAMCAGAAMCLAQPALAQVSDEDLDAAIAKYFELMQDFEPEGESFGFEEFDTMAQEAMEGIALADLSTEQMITLNQSGILTMAYDEGDVNALIAERAESDEPGSGSAAMLRAETVVRAKGQEPGNEEEVGDAVIAFLEHPRAEEALAGGSAMSILGAFGYLEFLPSLDAAMGRIGPPMVALTEKAVASDNPNVIATAPAMIDALAFADVPESKVLELKTAGQRNVAEMLADASLGDEQRDTLRGAENAFTRAEREAALVGNEMPAMDIIWSSNEGVEGFGDYAGKVLILDFWATWCGPCIASFPQVRELVEMYEGYDVAVVGVTSVQGTHYPQDGSPVDCEGEPEKEFALMAEFMENNDVTWDVVFTEQPVFNDDYVVEGIPHVVIVDHEGVLRHRGLHPMDDGKPAKINELLEAAGKDAPEI